MTVQSEFLDLMAKKLFAILDGSACLAVVAAHDSLGALDAYAVREGFAPYSEIKGQELIDAGGDDFVYERGLDDGTTLGAVFTNYEIAVYPLSISRWPRLP